MSPRIHVLSRQRGYQSTLDIKNAYLNFRIFIQNIAFIAPSAIVKVSVDIFTPAAALPVPTAAVVPIALATVPAAASFAVNPIGAASAVFSTATL